MMRLTCILAYAFSTLTSSAFLAHGLPTKQVLRNDTAISVVDETLASSGHAFSGQITWYTGVKLADPACGGPEPTDDSYVVAIPYGSKVKCWDWVTISYNGKKVKAQAVDRCATCALNGVDATKSVFEHLAPLKVGELNGATIRIH